MAKKGDQKGRSPNNFYFINFPAFKLISFASVQCLALTGL